jgi:outer membrane lipoprotein-sorting protein
MRATLAELVKKVDAWSQDINTLTAAVEFKPTTGSVYTGVINEYQNVGGFILLKKPAMIRIIGQAPVVKTEIFDMVSDGKEFRVSIPPKSKFIVGSDTYRGPSKKPLENLRPQHILDALLIPPVDKSAEKFFNEEVETPTGRYYVVNIVEPSSTGELTLKRKVWFDRSDLHIARLQLYGPDGSLLEDVRYADYNDFQGTSYPAEITLDRPVEGYKLSITIEKATFNQPIPPEKFILKKPPNAALIELGGEQ